MRYRVTGPHVVAGSAPGELVDVSGMTRGQLAALVEAGHVQKEKRQKEKVEASDREKEEAT